jgi:hypothetical protein
MKFQHSTIATALAAGIAGLATAGIPVMTVSVSSSGGGSGSQTPTGTAVAGSPNQYRYDSSPPIFAPGNFVSSYTLYAMDSQAAGRQAMGGLITVINSSATTQTYTVNVSASTFAQAGATLLSGSMSGALQDAAGDGATFAIGGTSGGWAGFINNGGSSTQVGSLFSAPLTVSAAPWMTAQIAGQSFGIPTALSSATSMGTSSSIRITFQLSAGDRVDLTTAFVVAVPAPGAFALAAAAGLVGTTRRRRA